MRRPRLAAKKRLLAAATLVASLALALTMCAALSVSAASSAGSAAPKTEPSKLKTGPAARVAVVPATAPASFGDLLTYDYGNTRSGHDTVDPAVKNISARPVWDRTLDGAVYGEPLVYDKTVYVATENDSVYAIAAGSGRVLWHLHVGRAVSTSIADTAPTLNGSCGDIDPLGITGTPVIDAGSHEIFVAAETELAGHTGWQGIRHWLVAIGLRSHRVLWHRDIDPPHGNSASDYYIPAEQQRPALTLANGRVYVAMGGLAGDCGQYHGFVVAIAVSGAGARRVYKVPSRRQGAIWETNGAVVSSKGDLYVATGNGSSGRQSDYDEGNSVIELSPTLKRLGSWAPSNWVQLNGEDWDLGSAGPINVPGTSLLFVAGKPSDTGDVGYLMTEGHLGGIGRGAFSSQVCPDGGDFGANASDVVGKGKKARTFVYAPCGSGTEAIQVTASPKKFRRVWSPSTGFPNGPPIVAGGIVWALDYLRGELYGMNPATGHVVYRKPTDELEHFATPGFGDEMLLIPTAAGVEAFRTSSS